MTQYTLDDSEIRRAECAEKNIREYIGNKLEDLECEIIYYRPMYIFRRFPYDPIRIFAPGAHRDSGKEFSMEAKFYDRFDEEGIKKMPEIIAKAKEFASKYRVSHVLPYGPNILRDPLRREHDKSFTPIKDFEWEKYYW
jgi:hypothetical protein